MPFFVGDYLSATTRLTTEQHGAYILLLLDYWKNGPPPNDDAVLAQIVRLSPAAWRKAKPALIGFFDVKDGKLIQKRVERERVRAAENVEKRRQAGIASANARAKKASAPNERPADVPTHVPTHVEAPLEQNGRPSPSPCSSEQVASTNVEVSAEPTERPLTKHEVIEAWQTRMVPLGFPAIRKMNGQRERLLRARLKDSTLDEWLDAMAALERSAFCRGENPRGWRADFDFLLQPKSFTGLLEGKYDH
jgi:uncharacterized protein YdaU (DUF1376 family)